MNAVAQADVYEDLWGNTVLGEMFEVSTILPSQASKEDGFRAVRDLIGAVLETALHDLQVPTKSKWGWRIRAEAKRWVEGNVGLITFEEACEALGLETEIARGAILRGDIHLTQRKLRGLKQKIGG